MSTASQPPELSVSDVVEVYPEELKHPVQPHEPKFDLDDAFSVHADDESISFDFDPDSFLKHLRLRATAGTEEESGSMWECGDDEEPEDMQDSRHSTNDSTDASVSTLDIDTVVDLRHSISTPPQPSSPSQSFDSEDQPSTPDDTSNSAAELSSQFTNVTLSPPLHSSPHPHLHELTHGYPTVIIDASKTPTNSVVTIAPEFPTSLSQRSNSSTSEPSVDPVPPSYLSNGTLHRATQSVSPNFSAPVPIPSWPAHYSTPSLPAATKSRSSGPSTFEKVVSKTRPPHLPPKHKQEDEKHNKEWEEMMQKSRMAGMCKY